MTDPVAENAICAARVTFLADVARGPLFVISYLKLTGCPIGLMINFHVTLLKHGIRKVVRPDLYKKRSPVAPVSPV